MQRIQQTDTDTRENLTQNIETVRTYVQQCATHNSTAEITELVTQMKAQITQEVKDGVATVQLDLQQLAEYSATRAGIE